MGCLRGVATLKGMLSLRPTDFENAGKCQHQKEARNDQSYSLTIHVTLARGLGRRMGRMRPTPVSTKPRRVKRLAPAPHDDSHDGVKRQRYRQRACSVKTGWST
jgi:hypothetical protein